MKKIAVIGSGISGLACCSLLKDSYDVHLFEKNPRPGGHSNTIDVNMGGAQIPVDTGFIVFNDRTYPNLCAFFDHLGIDSIKSEMSFGISIDEGHVEYSTATFSQFFAQRRNIISPSFLRMGFDILKFNRRSFKMNPDELGDMTLDGYLDALNMSEVFRRNYLYPMAGSIWSTPLEQIGSYPVAVFIRFFQNHGLVTVWDHPQWYTVKGGSRTYVSKVVKSLAENVYLQDAVISVKRANEGIELRTASGRHEKFDHVIIATPANVALAILEEPTKDEKEVLGQFDYSKNKVILHSDDEFMPRNKKAWSSWVYMKPSHDDGSGISLTYWMNSLQQIESPKPIFVTLNPHKIPKSDLIYAEVDYDHPVFDRKAIWAQHKLPEINDSRIMFCGSYQSYGFHEDGINSALRVVNKLGVKAPWQ